MQAHLEDEIQLAKFQGRVAAKRRDHLHKVARNLVTRFGRIGIEDLNIKGLAGGMLAKHVHDAAWAQLTAMLDYKAASAGVELVKVDPRGTSQTCPSAGSSLPRRSPSASTAANAGPFSTGTLLQRRLCTSGPSVSGPERAVGRQASGLPPSFSQKLSPSGDGSSLNRLRASQPSSPTIGCRRRLSSWRQGLRL